MLYYIYFKDGEPAELDLGNEQDAEWIKVMRKNPNGRLGDRAGEGLTFVRWTSLRPDDLVEYERLLWTTSLDYFRLSERPIMKNYERILDNIVKTAEVNTLV